MRPTTTLTAAVALALVLALPACSSDDDDAATDEATADEGVADGDGSAPDDGADDGAADGAAGQGRWSIDGTAYTGMTECAITTIDDGTTLEVLGEGGSAGGGAAQLRLVDSPPSIGDASLRITVVDRGEYQAELEPSGGLTGEVDDLFWEVDDTDTFFLLGEAALDDGTTVTIDLEVGCERIG